MRDHRHASRATKKNKAVKKTSKTPVQIAVERRREKKPRKLTPDEELLVKAVARHASEPKRPPRPRLPNPPVPMDVDECQRVFTAGVIGTLLPEWDLIPEEFKRGHTRWHHLVAMWFGTAAGHPDGLPADAEFHAKPGLGGAEKAYTHIMTCLRSWDPRHQHKIAGCAWLAHCFFEKVVIPSLKMEYSDV